MAAQWDMMQRTSLSLFPAPLDCPSAVPVPLAVVGLKVESCYVWHRRSRLD
jgi:hypothetical protein